LFPFGAGADTNESPIVITLKVLMPFLQPTTPLHWVKEVSPIFFFFF